ncbi:RNA-binding S4 domain-containing protein [Histidinibacterium aquaticum]|uniref:RNA-binding S4 domain-containing protein n=1 Tax=Histidinibacterium aquaticum TaxID=2613962 RepID=A0A5J5GPC6_9RHOB|nr:RNA-binding S4 domain-containing protein [Histidinibacterium aquaticum]KAA9010236.1 RNA-binding S4 domain-containing protein [Histidinibacterium aquaticum]
MEPRPTLRIDKWLWQARFFKTRGRAAELVSAGRVRLDGAPIAKPARAVGPGDVLTFPQGERIRVVRIVAIGTRRGPAPEARELYEDLTPEPEPKAPPPPRYEGKGRPSAKDRRDLAKHGPKGA